jgi:hypothetical protein
MRTTATLAGVLLLAICPWTAIAATRYVRKTGNDSNTGSIPSQAWLTIQKAASTAVAGDIIYVGAGTYSEFVQPTNDGTAGSPIKYYADTDGSKTGDAGSVIIDGGSGNARALECNTDDYQQFYYFKFTGGNQSAINWTGSVGGRLEGCEIYSSISDGIVCRMNSSMTVYQCTVRDNVDYGFEVIEGATITIDQCQVLRNTKGGIAAYGNASNNSTIKRCQVADNPAHGVYIDQGTSTITNLLTRGNTQHGLYITAGTVTVWHMTSAYNSLSGVNVTGGTVNMRNSICANNSNYGLLQTAGIFTHTYNCVYGNSWGNFSGATQSTGETTSDPRFWSASCLELQDGSSCYNTGTNPGGAVTDDLEGQARPNGGGYDMGCYETIPVSYTDLVAAYTALSPYAWWRMNEAAGSGTAVDQMVSHPGTYQNGPTLYQTGVASGGYNKAVSFDGADDKVNLSSINPTVSTMSFIGWFKADDFDVTNADLIAKASGTADANYYWSLSTINSSSQQRLNFRFRAGGSTAVATASSGNLGTGAWVFVAGVYDGRAIVLYKDGVEVGRTTKTGTPDTSGAVNAALGDNPTGARPFDGLLDEFAIFTKALKPREIAAIYAAGLKGSITAGVTPKLWGIDEDDSNLFSFTNYNTPSTTITTYGRLKWNNGGTITDFGDSYNISSIAINRYGRAYLTCDTTFGSHTAPTLMFFDLSSASTTQPNVVSIIGQVPTTIELHGLAIDPTTDELYCLRSDGWLFVLNTTNASIVRTVGQVTGLGDVCTTGEDLCFDGYGNLWVMDDADDEFYLVNKSNAAIINVVPGGTIGTVQGIAWDIPNSRILATETTSSFIISAAANLQSASYITGLGTLGLTDIECIGFVPTEGRTGVYPTGVRVIKWKEIK